MPVDDDVILVVVVVDVEDVMRVAVEVVRVVLGTVVLVGRIVLVVVGVAAVDVEAVLIVDNPAHTLRSDVTRTRSKAMSPAYSSPTVARKPI